MGVLVASVAGDSASAQSSRADEWQQGTALSLFAGAHSTSVETNAAAGAAVAWEFTPWVTVEGSGIWADGPNGSTSFAAIAAARINLLSRRKLVPFLTGGVGMYRVSFGTDTTAMHSFYRRRMVSHGQVRDAGDFADVAFALGGGLDIFLHRHLAVRPDVRVLLVTADSSVYPATVVGVHLAYHFESHNVTPARVPFVRSR